MATPESIFSQSPRTPQSQDISPDLVSWQTAAQQYQSCLKHGCYRRGRRGTRLVNDGASVRTVPWRRRNRVVEQAGSAVYLRTPFIPGLLSRPRLRFHLWIKLEEIICFLVYRRICTPCYSFLAIEHRKALKKACLELIGCVHRV